MNLREFANLKSIPISRLGSAKIITNITGEEFLTPQKEMNRAFSIFLKRPFVNSGVRQICRFKRGTDLRFQSEDKNAEDFCNKWLNNRTWVKKEINKYYVMREVTGNPYLEPVFDSRKKFNGFLTFPDSSRVYLNTEFKDINKDYWVVEVPFGVKQINGKSPAYYKINYIYGSSLWQSSVYGIPYPKNYFETDKMGIDITGLYGRSYLASVIDDEEGMMQIIKNIVVIAKYRAMNNKIIYPGTDDDFLIEDDKDQIRDDMLNLKDGEHLISSKKLEINSLSNQGEYDTMTQETDFLRKDMQSGLTPNFVTPWNADVNVATAAQSKIPFEVEIEEERQETLKFLSGFFVRQLKLSYPDKLRNANDLELISDPIRLDGKDELMMWSSEDYNNGLITFNEARKIKGYQVVKNGDKYNWQIQSQNPEADLYGESLKEGMSKMPLKKFMKLYGDKFGIGDCRKAANKVIDLVDGYRVDSLSYTPGLGEPFGFAGTHYFAISKDGKEVIDLTFPQYASKLIRSRNATPWIRTNRNKQIFKKTDYMRNILVNVE